MLGLIIVGAIALVTVINVTIVTMESERITNDFGGDN